MQDLNMNVFTGITMVIAYESKVSEKGKSYGRYTLLLDKQTMTLNGQALDDVPVYVPSRVTVKMEARRNTKTGYNELSGFVLNVEKLS